MDMDNLLKLNVGTYLVQVTYEFFHFLKSNLGLL